MTFTKATDTKHNGRNIYTATKGGRTYRVIFEDDWRGRGWAVDLRDLWIWVAALNGQRFKTLAAAKAALKG